MHVGRVLYRLFSLGRVAVPVARPASGVWSPVYSRLVSCRLSPRV